MLPYEVIHKRIRFLRVAMPIIVVALVALYLFGPARWIHSSLGLEYHMLVELIFFGSLGPAVVFLLLDLLARWIEERQTSELQARFLEEARADIQRTRLQSDNALQSVFAASMQLASLRKQLPDMPQEANQALEEVNFALQRAVNPLRCNLEKQSPKSTNVDTFPMGPIGGEFPYWEQ
jgi:hypothetical protein